MEKKLSTFSWDFIQLYKLKILIHRFLTSIGAPICCGVYGPCFSLGKRRRQNTMYCDDSMNWVIACDSCMKEIDDQWSERWDEYRLGVL